MNDLNPHLMQALGAVLAVLLMILAWIGNRIHKQLDDIKKCLHDDIKNIERDVARLYTRTEALESKCTVRHTEKGL